MMSQEHVCSVHTYSKHTVTQSVGGWVGKKERKGKEVVLHPAWRTLSSSCSHLHITAATGDDSSPSLTRSCFLSPDCEKYNRAHPSSLLVLSSWDGIRSTHRYWESLSSRLSLHGCERFILCLLPASSLSVEMLSSTPARLFHHFVVT